ncbi:hypothetical protein EYF80_049643 [Liparis tanakae]|uniref:Uncharacterized protein n=1 Tax=Liparis tanakae TaxID=230148 RepID=A0A4Z2FIS5_9TELE|nr:hypothetical protein EYF80_049643 [Liparis tanakae]
MLPSSASLSLTDTPNRHDLTALTCEPPLKSSAERKAQCEKEPQRSISDTKRQYLDSLQSPSPQLFPSPSSHTCVCVCVCVCITL